MNEEKPIITNLGTTWIEDQNSFKEVLVEEQVLRCDGFSIYQDLPVEKKPSHSGFHSYEKFFEAKDPALRAFMEKQKADKIEGAAWSEEERVKIRRLLHRVEPDNIEHFKALALAKQLIVAARDTKEEEVSGQKVKQIIESLQPIIISRCRLSPVEWYHNGRDTAILGCYEARIYRREQLIFVLYKNWTKNSNLYHRRYGSVPEARREIEEELQSLNDKGAQALANSTER